MLLGAAILCAVLCCDVMLSSVVSHCTVLLGAAILCAVLCCVVSNCVLATMIFGATAYRGKSILV